MLQGFSGLSGFGQIIFTLVVCHITLLCVTLYLHRSQAHRSVDFHPALNHFFRAWLWCTTGITTREWVAVHRKHHARCETEEDPHSPVVYGIKKVLFQGVELYRKEAVNPETIKKYSHGCPNDWFENELYSKYTWMGVNIMLVINLLLFGWTGVFTWVAQMLTIPILAAGVINGIGHFWGYRNYESEDASTNITPVAFIIAGEELHNNHHAYPSSAKFSIRAWEFDIGWGYIRILSALGLARVIRVAPKPVIDCTKNKMDLDSVKAIIVSRLHVMENYASGVIKPVHREALANANGNAREVLLRAKKPLIMASSLMNDADHKTLLKALEDHESLNMVYEYRRKLQDIWNEKSMSQERLVQSFQEWCVQAENSGIDVLQEFAAKLKGYTLQQQTVVS